MKLNKTVITSVCATAFLALATGSALAKMTAAEADRLGKDLTPVGGEMAGNKEGTIPAYDGGLKAPPAGWDPSKGYADPFAADARDAARPRCLRRVCRSPLPAHGIGVGLRNLPDRDR